MGQVLSYLTGGADFLGAILAVALLVQKTCRRSNSLLALLLLLRILLNHLSRPIIDEGGLVNSVMLGSAFLTNLVCMTLSLFYVQSLTRARWRLESRDLIFLLPLLLGAAWCTPALWWDHAPWSVGKSFPFKVFVQVSLILLLLFGSFYLYHSHRLIRAYEKKLAEVDSCASSISMTWLQIVLSCMYLFWITHLVSVFSLRVDQVFELHLVAQTLAIAVMGYFALSHSRVFEDCRQLEQEREGNHGFSPVELTKQTERLRKLFEEEHLYLDPNLRLATLAFRLDLRPGQVSEILNRGMGSSFFDFVNRYRVQEAQKRLLDPEYAHLNILGIGLDSGFNSKSSFGAAFRKWTGQTPSGFRLGTTIRHNKDQ